MQNTMSSRHGELSRLQSYIKDVDKEVTMILQSLQWDRKLILQRKPMSTCKYDSNHKIPPEKLQEHEEKCVVKSQGYAQDDIFLPDVFDPDSNTVLKLSSENIVDIINYASKTDPMFKRGATGPVTSEPLTAARLQAAYTADERRAIYDVVIRSQPACGELADLALGDAGDPARAPSKRKSKLEQLAEFRDLRRRRVKYRVAVRSRNYSHTLRSLIETQMEMYTEVQSHSITEPHDEPDAKYPKDKEEHSYNPPEKNVIEHRGFSKENSRYNSDRRNYSENKRKRSYDDDKNYRKYEKDRYQTSAKEKKMHYYKSRDSYKEEIDIKNDNKRKRGDNDDTNDRMLEKERHQTPTEEIEKHDNNDRRRKQEERSRNFYRNEIDDDKNERHSNFSKEKKERYRSSSIDRQRYRESEIYKQYYKDTDRNFTKQERDRYSSSSRDIQKYHGSEREVRYDKDRNYIKQERDTYSSYSRDSQRYRESEREERCNKDKDRYGERQRIEYKKK